MTNEEFRIKNRNTVGRLTVVSRQIDSIMAKSHERVSKIQLQPLIDRQQEIIDELTALTRDYFNEEEG